MSCNLRGADHMPYAAICHSIAVASCHGAPEPSGTCVCEVLPVCHDRPCMPNSEGGCFRSFHRHCLGLTKLPEGAFVCDACQTGVETCLGCRQLGDVSEMRRCTHPACGKTFHRQCARELPRAAGAPQSARPPARPCAHLPGCCSGCSKSSLSRADLHLYCRRRRRHQGSFICVPTTSMCQLAATSYQGRTTADLCSLPHRLSRRFRASRLPSSCVGKYDPVPEAF